jgi:hypothetical protein
MFHIHHRATAEVRCRKHHHCAACQARFSYIMVRKIEETSSISGKRAERNATAAAEQTWRHGADLQPCPQCGTVQLEMSYDVARPLLSMAAWVGCGGIGGALFLSILAIPDGSDPRAFAGFAAAAAVAAAGLAAFAVLRNLNATPQRNLAVAADRVRKALLRYDQRGTQGPVFPIGGIGSITAFRIGTALLAAAVPITIIPLVLPSVLGWTSNPTCKPHFIGAGDTAHFTFPEPFHSVGGFWNGESSGTATIEGSPPTSLKIETKTRDYDWRNQPVPMEPPPFDRPKQEDSILWVDVTFGDHPDVAGRNVRLDLWIDVHYPRYNILKDQLPYSVQRQTVSHTTQVTLASPRAHATLASSLWAATGVSLALALGAAACFRAGREAVLKQSRLVHTEPLTNSMANYNLRGD